jgi:uncharacterized protein YecE (DUF72 family)
MISDGIRFGIAGWSYPDWDDVVYPGKTGDKLAYVARFFDAVEINSTFYRIPAGRDTASWARRVSANPHFSFTVKIFRGFTHEPGPFPEKDAGTLRDVLEPLRESGKLGALLAQFPWSFKSNPDNQFRLGLLISAFRGFAPLVLEVRHDSWNYEGFYRMLEENGVGFCNIDQPVFRRSLKPTSIVTGGRVGYVRLHGRNYDNWFREDAGRDNRYDYLYSDGELDEWVERIQDIAAGKAAVYVIANNHFRGKGACNILQLKSKFTGGRVEVPPTLLSSFPELGRVSVKSVKDAEAKGQLDLF